MTRIKQGAGHNVKLLVYGPRKAGTTVTQRLVDNKKMLCHSGETKIKSYFELQKKIRTKETISEKGQMFFFQGSKNERLFPSQLQWIDEKLNSIESLYDYILASLEFFHTFGVRADSPTTGAGFIIKEVGGNPKAVISSFLSAFPDGSVLQVLRNPYYIASAIFRNRRDKGIRLTPRKIFAEAREAFSITAEMIRQDEIRRSDPAFHTCVYEELTENPEAFVKRVTELYSLPVTPEPIPTQSGHKAPVKTASNKELAGKIFKRDEAWYQKLSGLEIITVISVSLCFRKTLSELDKLKKRAAGGFI